LLLKEVRTLLEEGRSGRGAGIVPPPLDRFLLPALAGPVRLVPLSALETSELSLSALREAAKRGRLRGTIQRGQWYSTRQWVEEYRASRYRRVTSRS
jgi:hypothetical protein